MKTPTKLPRAGAAGFTLVEVMISMTIVVMVMGMAMSTFLFSLRTMYKDSQRLATNASLRYFMSQVSKETIDSTEFYIFPHYTALNGNVNITPIEPDTSNTNDLSPLVDDGYGARLCHGDCLVLVTRTSLAKMAKVQQFIIYYRVLEDGGDDSVGSELRCYKSKPYGENGAAEDLVALLNEVNLRSTPAISGSVVLAKQARGRIKGWSKAEVEKAKDEGRTLTETYYPVFCSAVPTLTLTNKSVSINVEIINGTNINNLLSSSSFNYTISPRR